MHESAQPVRSHLFPLSRWTVFVVSAVSLLSQVNTQSFKPVLYQWVHWAVVWADSKVSLYINGQPSASGTCPTLFRANRPSCYIGRDHKEQRYSEGRVASFNLFDWPLAPHEVLATSKTLLPPTAAFTVTADFPTAMSPGNPASLIVYSPFMLESAVQLIITANISGVLPANPYTIAWANSDNLPKTVTVNMPAGASAFNLTFATALNPRFLAPNPVVVGLFTTAGLFAQARKTISVTPSTVPTQATYVPSQFCPGFGSARFNAGGTYLDWNSLADTGSSAQIDPNLMMKGNGWTLSGWWKIDSFDNDNFLFSYFQTGQPHRAYSIRNAGNCLFFQLPDILKWNGPAWPFNGYTQKTFACGQFAVGTW